MRKAIPGWLAHAERLEELAVATEQGRIGAYGSPAYIREQRDWALARAAELRARLGDD